MKEEISITKSIVFLVVVIIAVSFIGTIAAIWYNMTVAIPYENSKRNVTTCSQQYITTQKARIENDLEAIHSNDVEIAKTTNNGTRDALQQQKQGNADDIYNALDASQCSRAQIISDLPELDSFFRQFPSRG
jgi:hypothetical protein